MCSESHDVEFLSKLESAHEHMTGHINRYVNAWNRGDIAAAMDTFVETDLDYTDHGAMRYHMDKPSLRAFFGELLQACGNIKIKTIMVKGAHDFCVWESETEFIAKMEIPGTPVRKGEKALLHCASLMWWNMDRKITKEVDYAVWRR
ncbi:hypothetical protein N7476_004953 [Penicillium atrosanguineum]|uniref:SnoaL-like domain-containing protein n=1 Tax=Penicillium atrosanguineum TaxID=1132637 RepID=A0A9W9PYE9_9EURO|nr:hypothetical protein N7526_001945 [Penicillium atrosanguineum]KAJ5318533.1 hypothetical protein N7476_004953 [Penicillium atrosanguineum]